ncbi:MAG: hypothetical protein R3C60_07510 [Parvularculaceae bacterium]
MRFRPDAHADVSSGRRPRHRPRDAYGASQRTVEAFCKAFFEVDSVKTRFRPHFFPFTEPSANGMIGYERVGNEGASARARNGWRFPAQAWCIRMFSNCGLDRTEYCALRSRDLTASPC